MNDFIKKIRKLAGDTAEMEKSGSSYAVPDREKTEKADESVVREHITVYGRVQGVGFRWRAVYAARDLGLTGWVENELDGSVEMEVQGPVRDIGRMMNEIRTQGGFIEITDTLMRDVPVVEGERTFRVRGY